MRQYIYSFNRYTLEDDVFFKFKKFPEAAATLSREQHDNMSRDEIQKFAEDGLITALQNRISSRSEIPPTDNLGTTIGDGFIILSVQQAMKLELFEVYRANCKSVSDFARILNMQVTLIRRMLDLRHASAATEIEDVLAVLGKRLIHSWAIETISSTSRLAKPRKSSKILSRQAAATNGDS